MGRLFQTASVSTEKRPRYGYATHFVTSVWRNSSFANRTTIPFFMTTRRLTKRQRKLEIRPSDLRICFLFVRQYLFTPPFHFICVINGHAFSCEPLWVHAARTAIYICAELVRQLQLLLFRVGNKDKINFKNEIIEIKFKNTLSVFFKCDTLFLD